MLTYKAMFKFVDGGVHAEVLDFPGAITCGRDLNEARRLLSGALVDIAETHWLQGKALPTPNPNASDSEADIEEPIHLLLNASSRITQVAEAITT